MSFQLSFAPAIAMPAQSVQLVGSWDCYQSQLPLQARSGVWKGKYKFSAPLIKAGTRYWYYFIVDGCHAIHDSSRPSTVEPTTGRTLNVLEIPASSVPQPALSIDTRIARGRPVSPSQIVSPRPVKPNESKQVLNYRYSASPDDNLSGRFGRMGVSTGAASRSSSQVTATSIADSDVPSLTSSRGSFNTTPTSISSGSADACTCQRYGITRRGERVKLDCGGTICGSDAYSSSSCSDEDDHVNHHVTTVAASAQPSAQPKLRVNTNVGIAVNQVATPVGPGLTPLRTSPSTSTSGKTTAVDFAVQPPTQYYSHHYAQQARSRPVRY